MCDVVLPFRAQWPWNAYSPEPAFCSANSLIQFFHSLRATDSRYVESARTTQETYQVSDCLFIGPLPALGMARTT
jgi:hypothetical protein